MAVGTPVIDFKGLNLFIFLERFKIEVLQTIVQVVQTGDWILSVDLQVADPTIFLEVLQVCSWLGPTAVPVQPLYLSKVFHQDPRGRPWLPSGRGNSGSIII